MIISLAALVGGTLIAAWITLTGEAPAWFVPAAAVVGFVGGWKIREAMG